MFDFHQMKKSRITTLVRTANPPWFQAAFSLGLLVLASGNLTAKTVYVNGKASASGNGTSWSRAYKYLRDALDHTRADDKILVAKGTYYPDDGESGSFGDREFSFELKGQKIYGGFAGTESNIAQRNPKTNPTILSGAIWSGDNASDFASLHVVVVHQDSVLDGLIVEDGHANGGHSWNYPIIQEFDQGGGCRVDAGRILTLNDCTFRNNRALADGGAIYLVGDLGKVVATNCTFHQNEIRLDYNVTTGNSRGGAIKGNVDATNCKFTSNSVSAMQYFEGPESVACGGAIAGKVKAVRCEFTGNRVSADRLEKVTPTADGGAVFGDFTGTQCVFTDNEAFATDIVGVSSGGAISGAAIKATNCAFSSNKSGTGLWEFDKVTPGGGGAVYTTGGTSSLANCVFVGNSSEFRGGAVQAGVETKTDSIFISNCTFLNNHVTTHEYSVYPSKGAALGCGGIVRILNNIFWYTEPVPEGIDRSNLLFISFLGALRNSDENYPAPSSAAPNLVKGGESSISRAFVSDLYLVSPAILFVDSDPMFVDLANPAGADNRWGTDDDGLRLKAGSPAIGKSLDPRVSGFVDVRPKDAADADQDENLSEKLPVDMTGYVRVQNRFVEIGAYEFGNLPNVPEIAVLDGTVDLKNGITRNFGKARKGDVKKLTFTIKSIGTNGLTRISTSIEGSKEITLQKAEYKPLEPGSEATVTVTFKPKSAGKFSAKLRIASSDADENPFLITLTGKGVVKKTKSKPAKKPSESSGPTGIPAGGWVEFSAGSGNAAGNTSTVNVDGEKYLALTVLKSAEAPTGTIEVSSDLVQWFSGAKHTTTLVDNATYLKVRDNTPLGTGGKRFIRLK